MYHQSRQARFTHTKTGGWIFADTIRPCRLPGLVLYRTSSSVLLMMLENVRFFLELGSGGQPQLLGINAVLISIIIGIFQLQAIIFTEVPGNHEADL